MNDDSIYLSKASNRTNPSIIKPTEGSLSQRDKRISNALSAFVKISAIISWWKPIIGREIKGPTLEPIKKVTEQNLKRSLLDAIRIIQFAITSFHTLQAEIEINLNKEINELSTIQHKYESLLSSFHGGKKLSREEIIGHIASTIPTLEKIKERDTLTFKRRKLAA